MKKIIVLFAVLLSFAVPMTHAQITGIPEIPQIPAFLPWSHDVPMTDKLPIDGEWMITAIRKRIRIEGGRAYAIDSWLHLFVLKIEPMMVVQKQWRRTGPGEYAGEDLPLMGPFTATLNPNGQMTMRIQGVMGPVTLTLVPVRADNQKRFDREKSGKLEDEERYSEDEEEYSEDEEYSEEDEYYEDETEYSDEEEYAEDEEYYEDEEEYSEEDEGPKKVAAIKIRKARKGCKGKQIYLSRGACYSCPSGYRRFSPTRKMTHPKACTERGLGRDTVKAKYLWQANGCKKGQFKHKGYCKVCPESSKRIHVAGLDTGYCKVLR
ncbi:hypothetical protein [Pseudoteredinibacter isoporae]|uniref:hypothetical protein n=1 Tax=Pseudoteredinibacter isoporae TaxID=570281 RepID=UPI00310A0FB3